eukprot:GHUV01025805.1.p1 GENE.GHUV01025805.1~~GHUV01025805.1.p1  ORF type:complete len:260 (+),score=65.37 GHUV01025805.1:1642-2421(+)
MLQVGMRLFLMAGMFQHKPLGQLQVFPLAAAYIGYIVLCNLSLNVNTVGFYQVMKIAVAPTVMLLELLFFRVVPPAKVVASVFVVCLGIAIATVTDSKLISNLLGLAVGAAATFVTALYQIWAGSKQKELQASSMQLLHAYTPQAAVILLLMIPIMEPMGWGGQDPNTLLGYKYTPAAVVAIVVSSLLGILVRGLATTLCRLRFSFCCSVGVCCAGAAPSFLKQSNLHFRRVAKVSAFLWCVLNFLSVSPHNDCGRPPG